MFIKVLVIIFLIPLVSMAKVFTTLPEFAWVVRQLDSSLEVTSLLEGTEDPHFIDASPSFVFKLTSADVVIQNGMDLEVGWLPKVVEQTGNTKIQLGANGFCDASILVSKVEQIKDYDRSMGDVHPVGNPHYSISPKQMKMVAKQIANCLSKVYKKDYVNKLKNIDKKLDELGKLAAEKLKGKRIFVYHREFSYLKSDYGLVILQSIEEVPGVLPSAVYLSKMAKMAKAEKPIFVLASNTAPVKILEKFKELSKIDYKLTNLHPTKNEDYVLFFKKFLGHFE